MLTRVDYRRLYGSVTIAVILFSVFVGLVNFKPVVADGGGGGGGGTLPVVAIHVSENTQSHWTNGNWTYWAVYKSLEGALTSDGTPFAEVNDSTIEAGGLLSSGLPKYPILISLAAECISDAGASQILQYVSAGGFAYVGSSAWTRYSNGTARSNFALSAQMGVTCVAAPPNNYNLFSYIYVNATDQLNDILPINVNISPWNLPQNSNTSVMYTGGSGPHYFWQTYNTASSPADILIRIPSSPYPYIMLATKAYSTGRFIYQSELTPLMGFGIYAPGLYEYYFFRRAIEWAFQSQSMALAKLSPWPYQYDSAFLIRHDGDGGSSFVLGSAMREKTLGVTGEYWIMTGMLLDDPNNASLISQLQTAQNTYGALISSHNGGLNSHYWLGSSPGAYEYYHWGPDVCIVYNGTGDYPPYNGTSQLNPGHGSTPTNLYGADYANMSVKIALDNLTSWLGQRPITWVSPYTDSASDKSLDILASQGIKIAEERDSGPFPSMAFSLNTPGKYYDLLEFPSQAWATSSGTVYQRLEEHSTATMDQMIDVLYNLGAMVNMYGHVSSSGGIGEAYISYCLSKSNMWNATTLLIRSWWLQRQLISITPTFTQSASGMNQLNVNLAGSTSSDVAVDLVLPTDMSKVFNFTVLVNGVPSTQYRKTSAGIKVKVGTATTLNVTWEAPPTEHWTQTTQADFESGTQTNLDTNSNPGIVSLAIQSMGGTSTLFSDDFSNSTWTNSQWTVKAGTWTVTSGLYQGVIIGNYQYTYAGNTSWTDYTIEAMTKWVSGSYGALIGARLNPSTGARYSFWIDSGTSVRLLRWSDWTTWTAIGSASTATHDNNWHTLKMVLAGSSIKCYYDGVLAISALDTTYSSGAINFESYGSTVQYDWVNVTAQIPTVYFTNGTLVSSAFDAGFNAKWLTISWAASTPSGTTLSFGTRTAPTQAGLSSASWSTYYAQSGSAVTSAINRWIQFEAILSSNSTSTTPTLDSVSVAYTSWYNWTQTSEADFESGTSTNLNTTAVPGQITLATATGGTTVTLFSDDFSDSSWTNSHWTVHAGTWTVTSGLYQGVMPSSDYGHTYAGSVSWTNYTVEAMAKWVSGGYGAQIGARLNPSTGARYAFWLYPPGSPGGPNTAKLIKYTDWSTWGTVPLASAATPTQDNNWHRLKMEVAGSTIKCYYDGSLIFNVVDSSYSTGAIDFESYASTIQYDWVNVTQSDVTVYYSSGSLVSSAFDTGFTPQWRWITWASSTPEYTAVKFRTRTAPTQADLNSASWSAYYTDPGYSLVASPTSEWIQYEANLSTSNTVFTPTLYDVTIWYSQSPPYGLTVNVVGQGTVSLNNTGPYQLGDVVQLNALPATGWSFASWSDNLTGSTNPNTITITGNMIVTATFTRNTYALSVLTVGSGSVILNNSGPSYYYGDAVDFTALPAIGWSFQSWSGGLTGSANPATLVIDSDKTVTATFTQNAYTLTISLSGQGSVSKSPDQATYTWGTNVTLTANPEIGWTFANWSGGASGTINPATVNITGNTGVTATFNQIPYTLTVNTAGNGVVNLNNSGPYHYGDTVQLTAVAASGYSFDHWNGDLTGSSNPATLTFTRNMVVNAYFVLPQVYLNPSTIQKGPADTYTTFQTSVMVNKITGMWGSDFKLTWDNGLITLVGVDFNTTLDNVWGHGNWYLAYNVSGAGYYELAAVSTSTGYTGTSAKPLATLTFIVKAAVGQTSIHFAVVKLSNSQAQNIQAEVTDGTYTVTGPQYQPVLQMTPSTITCRKYHEYFAVQINVTNTITVDGFSFSIYYSPMLMSYVSVTWGELGSGTITKVDQVNGILEGNVTGTAISGNRWLLNITFQDIAAMIWKDGQVNEKHGQIWFHYASLIFSGVQQLTYQEGGIGELGVNTVAFVFVPIQGDIDNNGTVEVFDLRTVAFFYDQENETYNLTGNGTIDIFDLVVIGANFGFTYNP